MIHQRRKNEVDRTLGDRLQSLVTDNQRIEGRKIITSANIVDRFGHNTNHYYLEENPNHLR